MNRGWLRGKMVARQRAVHNSWCTRTRTACMSEIRVPERESGGMAGSYRKRCRGGGECGARVIFNSRTNFALPSLRSGRLSQAPTWRNISLPDRDDHDEETSVKL